MNLSTYSFFGIVGWKRRTKLFFILPYRPGISQVRSCSLAGADYSLIYRFRHQITAASRIRALTIRLMFGIMLDSVASGYGSPQRGQNVLLRKSFLQAGQNIYDFTLDGFFGLAVRPWLN